jgi:hypothetical protein
MDSVTQQNAALVEEAAAAAASLQRAGRHAWRRRSAPSRWITESRLHAGFFRSVRPPKALRPYAGMAWNPPPARMNTGEMLIRIMREPKNSWF